MSNQRLTRLAATACAGALIALALPGGAMSALTLTIKGFLPDAHLVAQGHGVEVTGFVECHPAGERYVVNANVIQGDVTASRTLHGICHDGIEEWTTTLHTTRGGRLEPGHAEACGDAVSMKGNVVTGSVEWCKPGGLTLGY